VVVIRVAMLVVSDGVALMVLLVAMLGDGGK
jgi:hypothetical protein